MLLKGAYRCALSSPGTIVKVLTIRFYRIQAGLSTAFFRGSDLTRRGVWCKLPFVVRSLTVITFVALAAASAPAAPTLDATSDSVTISSGTQTLTVHLADGTLRLDTPYGSYDLTVNINSRSGWVHPGRAAVPPKLYRGKDSVAALITFPVPDDRTMTLHIDAYPGIDAVFAKSGVTGLFGSRHDYYFWSWNQKTDNCTLEGANGPETIKVESKQTRLPYSDWVYLPDKTGGLAVMTSGIVGLMPGRPFINALPRWRFLRPGETLDIGFGLAGAADASEAAALSKLARAKAIPALKRFSAAKQANVDYGLPAPDWLRNADMFNGWYGKWTADMINDWMKCFSLIVGVPASKSTIEKAHEAGLRVIVYVNYMELQNSEVQMAAKGRLYRQPDEATPADLLDLAKHPDWTCIDSEGNPRRSDWGISQDIAGLFATCFHQADLRQNALTHVCNIMNLGADGVFIDNAVPVRECYGPKFGKHVHPDAAETNTDAYELLQREIYKLVKTFGSDKIVMQNSGIAPSHWAYCDAQMWEGFAFDSKHGEPVNDWPELDYAAQEHAEAVRRGKVPVILSCFSAVPADRRREAVLYTYAYTRLHGWLLADWFDLIKSPESHQLARAIYSVRLGRPLSDAKRVGDLLYRAFEKGIVILNPTKSKLTTTIPTAHDGTLTDVAYDRDLTASGGSVRVEMAPESGRVLVWRESGRLP